MRSALFFVLEDAPQRKTIEPRAELCYNKLIWNRILTQQEVLL